jgi:2-oxoisovalerate dehydrogenase E1 component beta subunit
MMPTLNMIQAVNDALRTELRRDPRVVVLGEDIGKFGGVFRATSDLQKEFGEARVIDTPLAEAGVIGTAIGMALYGLRPVPEIQFADFIFPAFDLIVNELAKYRYRSGGEWPCPVVIRTPFGGGIRGGHYHSQSPEAYFLHTPGLKVIVPSNPYDAKGLLLSCIRQNDPVLFLEPKRVYRGPSPTTNWSAHPKGEVPENDYTLPLGVAEVVRPGRAVTVLAYGAMVHTAVEAARLAAERGIDCEVIDLRSLLPLDLETITKSVKKTGRAVVVHEAPRNCGFGAELSSLIQEHCFLSLEAPVGRVTGFDTPFPYTLEAEYLPSPARVLVGIEEVSRF